MKAYIRTKLDLHDNDTLTYFVLILCFFYGKFIKLGQKLQFIVITIVSLTNENLLQLKLSLSIYDVVEFLHLLFMIITKSVTAYYEPAIL